jgi:hypothetical protein
MYRQKPCETCPHGGFLPISALNSTLKQKGTSGSNKRLARFHEFLEQKKARKRGSNVQHALQRVIEECRESGKQFSAPRARTGRPPIHDEFTELPISARRKWRLRMMKECRCVKCGRPRPCHRH